MPLDQVHEQENAQVKGKGGVVNWLNRKSRCFTVRKVCGPELANCLDVEFRHRAQNCFW